MKCFFEIIDVSRFLLAENRPNFIIVHYHIITDHVTKSIFKSLLVDLYIAQIVLQDSTDKSRARGSSGSAERKERPAFRIWFTAVSFSAEIAIPTAFPRRSWWSAVHAPHCSRRANTAIMNERNAGHAPRSGHVRVHEVAWANQKERKREN